jgi:hypothetical protein
MSRSAIIRGAVADGLDGERVGRLAARIGSRPPEGLLLLAEVDGDPVAAIGIFDGHAISDRSRSSLALRMRLRVLRLQLRVTAAVYGV